MFKRSLIKRKRTSVVYGMRCTSYGIMKWLNFLQSLKWKGHVLNLNKSFRIWRSYVLPVMNGEIHFVWTGRVLPFPAWAMPTKS